MQDESGNPSRSPSPRVAVVGPCASGKSTLVAGLLEAGVDAWVVGQEHSAVRSLWARRNPDLVIALDLELDHVRARRGQSWPANLYAIQHDRLREAFANADITLDTGVTAEHDVLEAVLALVDEFRTSDDSGRPPTHSHDSDPSETAGKS